ncbi:MAG TPA: chemotaxis protein CheD [Polyangiaceae bacterium]|nr:chemotaxis protein CheD [Polyangiaceae bacterium]
MAPGTTPITVGVGDLQISTDVNSVLVTYGLGSCIAVLVWDPLRHAGGMVHYMLPLSSITPEKARARPAMFADTGVPLLFERMLGLGSRKGDLVVKVVGGACIQDDNKTFDIGKRNYAALRELLRGAGVAIKAEAVGGGLSRTCRLFVADGRATVRASDDFSEVEL